MYSGVMLVVEDVEKSSAWYQRLLGAASGVTTLCCPPDTEPVVDTPAVVELIHRRAEQSGKARVEVVGALTRDLDGEHLAEMGALREAGCVAVGNALRPVTNTEVMRRAMEYAATFGLTVMLHAEDPWLGRERVVHEERMLQGELGRIRDVRSGPDGYLYLLTDASDGRVLRLEPVE